VGALVEAIDKLYRLINRGEGGLEWKRAAENLGLVFLSDHFRANLLAAHEVLKVHCPNLRSAPLIHLMTHEDVWFAFATLVSYCIQNQDHSFPTRNYTTQAVDKLDRAAHSLISRFKRAGYGPDQELHFLAEWDPVDASLREIRQQRPRGGDTALLALQQPSSKRPRKPADTYETSVDRQMRARRRAMQALSGAPPS
jgi:hypothetical protein